MSDVRLSRREVLKAGGLSAAAALIGWQLPASSGRWDSGYAIESIPADIEECVMQLGEVTQVSPGLADIPEDLIELIYQRHGDHLSDCVTRLDGWTPVEMVAEWRYDVPPGGHDDPLYSARLLGTKQSWRMVRV